MEKIATITSKGQVVIPKSIRTLYSLKPQTKIIFQPSGDKIVLKLLKNKFANLNNKLAKFTVDENIKKDWESALQQKIQRLRW